jgi:hypothetical protein
VQAERLHVLLHEDGVRPRGQARAGEDAAGRAVGERCRCWLPRHIAPLDRQRRGPGRRQIGVAHRIAINRRVVGLRQVDRRNKVRSENAPIRRRQRGELDRRDRFDAFADLADAVLDREQRAAERKAIVGELGHREPLGCVQGRHRPADGVDCPSGRRVRQAGGGTANVARHPTARGR